MSWLDVLGLVAGVLVAMSLLMRSMRLLRQINLVGCSLFVVWGVLSGAMGVWICNAVGVVVNIYRMYEAQKSRKQ